MLDIAVSEVYLIYVSSFCSFFFIVVVKMPRIRSQLSAVKQNEISAITALGNQLEVVIRASIRNVVKVYKNVYGQH
jgi:hypothetical protein